MPLSAALCPADESTLQQLLDTWSSLAQSHAVKDMLPLIALQIARFTDMGQTRSGKISPDWHFALPSSSGPGIHVEHLLFRVVAICLSHGGQHSSGSLPRSPS